MRVRRYIGIVVVVIGFVALAAVLFGTLRSGFDMNVVNFEPSSMFDDAGREALLLTLSLRNRDSLAVNIKQITTFQAKVINRWIDVKQNITFDWIAPGRKSTWMLVVPAGTDACRFHLNYQSETWKSRLMVILGPTGRRLLAKSPLFVRKWLWPDQYKTTYVSPRWKQITLEVPLPPGGANFPL